jgi:hypothetical protein
MPTTPMQAGQQRRQVLLNLKCLFWCLENMGRQYDLNLVKHSLELNYLHRDLEDSNLGDNLQFLMEHLSEPDRIHILESLDRMAASRPSIDVGEKHFEVGHYVQAEYDFGPIADGSYGIITSVTPELRGLFYFDGPHLMESVFAPSNVRIIFGTYIS